MNNGESLRDDFHVIDRKINLDLFLDHAIEYYNRVKYDLKNKVRSSEEDSDNIFFAFEYTDKLEELWVARTFMTLQLEVVPNVCVPEGVEKEDIRDWLSVFRPYRIYFKENRELWELEGGNNG